MLRRPPTTLSITVEDVAAYEDRRASEALQAAQQARAEAEAQAAEARAQARAALGAAGSSGGGAAASHGSSPSATKRARDERIGLGRRPGGR